MLWSRKTAPVPQPRAGRGDKRQRESLSSSHEGPVQSRLLHPLPTCQNEGYPRVISSPNQTLIIVNARLPKGNLTAGNAGGADSYRGGWNRSSGVAPKGCGPASGLAPSRRPLRGLLRVGGTGARCSRCGRRTPPPGLAFGEPDDRLQRGIQYAAAYRFNYYSLWNTGSSAPVGNCAQGG